MRPNRLLCLLIVMIMGVLAFAPAYALKSSTLRTGDRGQDVRNLQQALIRLGYLSGKADGVFGPITEQAVRKFQQAYQLTVDGLAGKKTLAAIAAAEKNGSAPVARSDDAPAAVQASEPVSASSSAVHVSESSASAASSGSGLFNGDYSSIRFGDKGARVKILQQALIALGCLSGKADGVFGRQTLQAVYSFQHRQKLTEDGIAGRKTLSALEKALSASGSSSSSDRSDFSAPASADTQDASAVPAQINSKIAGPDGSSVRLLHWYNDIKPTLKNGDHLLVYDPASGLSWTLRVMSRGRHCDCEPLTQADTDTMVKAFGGNTWNQKGVYVRLPSGVWTVASTHDMPHLSGSIKDNGFDGHLCVHFLRDMKETEENDPNYGVSNQKTIRELWKKISGQDLDY